MKKFFRFFMTLAAASAVVFACDKPAEPTNEGGTSTDPGNGNNGGNGGQTETVKATVSADASFTDGIANVTVTLSAARDASTTINFAIAEDSQLTAANVTADAITIAKNRKSGSGAIAFDPAGLTEAGTYTVKLNVTAEGVEVVGSPITITGEVTEVKEARNGKALTIEPEISENFLFTDENKHDFQGNGGTFQVKFKPATFKNGKSGLVDRLCNFECRDENPAILLRFSNDDAVSGQLCVTTDKWGLKFYSTEKDDANTPYVFTPGVWHVLTVVIQPMTEAGVMTVTLYDNDKELNTASATVSSRNRTDRLYFERFELGMSWDADGGNYPESQLFDGAIDYARAWNRILSASEIAGSLCSVANDAEGLLVNWYFGNIDANGLCKNTATLGGSTYDIDFSKMQHMDGNSILTEENQSEKALASLTAEGNLCEF